MDKNFFGPLVRQTKPFVTHLEQIVEGVSDTSICLEEVNDLIRQWCCRPMWLDPAWFDTLTQRADFMLTPKSSPVTAVLTAWPAKWKGILHDHKAWSIVGCLYGHLRHSQWLPTGEDNMDKDNLSMQRKEALPMSARDVITAPVGAIYRVDNCAADSVGLSLHVYGDRLRDKQGYIYQCIDELDYTQVPDQEPCHFKLTPKVTQSTYDLTTEEMS